MQALSDGRFVVMFTQVGAGEQRIYGTVLPAPSVPDLDTGSDSGVSGIDDITNVSTPVFVGSATAGTTVGLYDGIAKLGSATADASGAWSITSTTLSSGKHSITAKAIDGDGNPGSASTALSVTIDTTPPATPGVPDLADASDSGASNADNITSATTLVFAGKAEANAAVTLLDGGVVVGTDKANASGSWSIKATALAEGVHAITVKASDTAGNSSSASTALSVTIDTTPPVAPSALDMTTVSDTGVSTADNVTAINTPTITGKVEVGATVTLFKGLTVLGTDKANASGVWVIKTTALTDGANVLRARAVDTAGNTGGFSATLTVQIDTQAPAAATVPDLQASSDSGVSSVDDLTNVSTPVLTGKAEANSIVTLYDGAVVVGTGKANGSGLWSIQTSALGNGAHAIAAKVSDVAGNSSGLSAALSVTVDTTASAPTRPDLIASSDTGVPDTDNLTRITTPTFVGVAEANASVTLLDGVAVIGSASADASGNWTITSSALADGSHSVTARQTDRAGNVSAESAAVTVVIDTLPPAAVPTGLALQKGSDSGASSTDRITNVTAPVIVGKIEPGALVTILDGSTVLGKTKGNTSGQWLFKAGPLSDGVHVFTATQTDNAGNNSAASTGLSVTIDATAPAPPVFGPVTTGAVSGQAEAGTMVTLFDDAAQIASVTVDGAGHWSIPVGFASGSHPLTATALDIAGNLSPVSVPMVVLLGTPDGDVLAADGISAAFGDAGNDIYLVDDPNDQVTEGIGGGTDTIFAAVGYTLPTAAEIEFLIANTGLAGVSLAGNGFASTIMGGAGADVISGGGGPDVLLGGGGPDTFVFKALSDSTVGFAGQVMIADFVEALGDRIDLSAIDANAGVPDDQAFQFIGAAAFSGVAGQLRATTGGGVTLITADVNGDTAADMVIRLAGSHVLNSGQFIL